MPSVQCAQQLNCASSNLYKICTEINGFLNSTGTTNIVTFSHHVNCRVIGTTSVSVTSITRSAAFSVEIWRLKSWHAGKIGGIVTNNGVVVTNGLGLPRTVPTCQWNIRIGQITDQLIRTIILLRQLLWQRQRPPQRLQRQAPYAVAWVGGGSCRRVSRKRACLFYPRVQERRRGLETTTVSMPGSVIGVIEELSRTPSNGIAHVFSTFSLFPYTLPWPQIPYWFVRLFAFDFSRPILCSVNKRLWNVPFVLNYSTRMVSKTEDKICFISRLKIVYILYLGIILWSTLIGLFLLPPAFCVSMPQNRLVESQMPHQLFEFLLPLLGINKEDVKWERI